MRNGHSHRFLKGAIAGMIGGFLGSWTMNQFQSGVSAVGTAWEKSAHKPQLDQARPSSDEAATTLLAERISQLVLRRDLTDDEKRTAEPIVHYAFGTLVGGLYGLMAELTPLTTRGAGCAYGTAVWLGGDEIAVPLMQLSKTPEKYPLSTHVEALASHLAYGLTLEGVRRASRGLM